MMQQLQKYHRTSPESNSPLAVLLAPTGVASFLVGGQTIHSRLHIPPKHKTTDLKGEKLKTFCKSLANTVYFFIDERSFIGTKLMCGIDVRLRQLRPDQQDQPFGGLSLILIGDIGQLSPVCDRPVFMPDNASSWSYDVQRAFMLHRQFNQAVILEVPQRQTGEDLVSVRFRDALCRLRCGLSTLDDWNFFMTRRMSNLPPNERADFELAPHIFTTNDEADSFNQKRLSGLQTAVARIQALHTGPGAQNATFDDVGLESVLYLAVNARVMLIANLWTQAGLVNGATGTVRGLVYDFDRQPPQIPTSIFVEFDTYTGPSFPGFSNCVPICPLKRTWANTDGVMCSRTMPPLALAFGRTVHKEQGNTLRKAAIHLGDREFTPGLSYVALSRVKRFEDLAFIEHFPFERLPKQFTSKALKERMLEDERVSKLGCNFQILLINVQSESGKTIGPILNKHKL